jgi:hypothetical protein
MPKGYLESVNRRRTYNTMAKRKRTKGQTTIRSIKFTHKTKDRIIRLLVGDVLSFYVFMLVMFNI